MNYLLPRGALCAAYWYVVALKLREARMQRELIAGRPVGDDRLSFKKPPRRQRRLMDRYQRLTLDLFAVRSLFPDVAERATRRAETIINRRRLDHQAAG